MDEQHFQFTKAHTQIAKGIAITLMMIHHLFRFPDRIQKVSYISILPLGNLRLEYLLGDFGNICIAMYLFLSGYGLYMSTIKKECFSLKDSWRKILKFLINYWVVFMLFVPIGLVWFSDSTRYHFNIISFLANLFTLSSSYNSEWWFVRLYIELLLLFPLISGILKRGIKVATVTSFGFYLVAIIMELIPVILPRLAFLKTNFIYGDLRNILFWQITFCMGCIIAKYKLFSHINKWIAVKRLDRSAFYIAIILGIIVIRNGCSYVFEVIGKGNPTYVDFILAPIFILIATNFVYKSKGKKVFSTLGVHSTNMWLTHTFFCYYYFQTIVFMPKLSILILIWLGLLSLGSSIIINFVMSASGRMLQKSVN